MEYKVNITEGCPWCEDHDCGYCETTVDANNAEDAFNLGIKHFEKTFESASETKLSLSLKVVGSGGDTMEGFANL